MPYKLIIKNLNNKEITCSETKSVLKNIQEAELDWMQACGGKGRCTTCAMYVCEGAENITPQTDFEQKQLEIGRLHSQERLSCQCFLQGDVVVKVPQRLKLPHLIYNE